MADFRKWIIVLFALTLFVGLGSAQVVPGQGSNMICNFTQTPTPPIRQESLVDATSDIVIGCTGGQVLAEGSVIPRANITVTLNATITSRLIKSGDSTTGASEALMIIDEPGAALPVVAPPAGGLFFGVNAPQVLCQNAATGCGGYIHYVPSNGAAVGLNPGQTVAVPVWNWSAGVGGAAPTVSGQFPNVYQGVVTGSSVTFYGVPVLPPGTSNVQRTFRITNIRVNPSSAGLVGATFGTTPVTASVSSSNALPLSQPSATVGFVLASMTTSWAQSSSSAYQTYLQCVGNKVSSTGAATTTLSYKELFGTAFKTRVVPLSNSWFTAQGTNPQPGTITQQPGNLTYSSGYGSGQSVPGGLEQGGVAGNFPANINSESDFIYPVATNCYMGNDNSGCAGLADFGTRFKAVFSNIPAGVTVYVSVTNNLGLNGGGQPYVPGGNFTPGGVNALANPYPAFAQLVSGEMAAEPLSATIAVGNVSFGGSANVVQLVPVNGSAVAVWEVINANPNGLDNFQFNVYTAVAAGTPTPAPWNANLVMSYAPTPTGINGIVNFDATKGGQAQAASGYPIPRFLDVTTPPAPFTSIAICQTTLLWPYVVTGVSSGLETGLAIANTTMDPFKTANQAGSCDLYWYGQNYTGAGTTVATGTLTSLGCDQTGANASACVPVIAAGTTWAQQGSLLQLNIPSGDTWAGYVIGVCRFQMAHGYAAISDLAIRNFLSSYLALVIVGSASPGELYRGPATAWESLSQ